MMKRLGTGASRISSYVLGAVILEEPLSLREALHRHKKFQDTVVSIAVPLRLANDE